MTILEIDPKNQSKLQLSLIYKKSFKFLPLSFAHPELCISTFSPLIIRRKTFTEVSESVAPPSL